MNLLLLLQLIGKKDNQFHEIFLLPLTIFINNALLFLSLNCFDSCSKLHHQYFLKEIKSMMHIKLYFLRLLFFLISYHFSQKPWSKFELAQKANSCVTFQSRRSSEFGRIPFLHGG